MRLDQNHHARYQAVVHVDSELLLDDDHPDEDVVGGGSGDNRGNQKGFAAWEGYCFTLNYILGVGILGIPHALVRTGFWTGVVMMVIVSVASWIAINWILEAMARAEAIVQYRACAVDNNHNQEIGKLNYRIATERKLEIVDIVDIFMGPKWKFTYQICIGIYLFGALWSYASVFGTSMASHVPFPGIYGGHTCDLYSDSSAACRSLYIFYLCIFMVVVVPLACIDLKEQKPVQITLSLMRFLAIGCMVISIWSVWSSTSHPQSPAPAASIGGIISFLPVAIYSQIFHHSVPGLTNPLKKKTDAPKIYGSVMLTTCILYSVLSVTVGLYFGGSIEEACTINWTKSDAPGGQFISYFIVLFPAFDVISAFPINAITLANNIYSERTFEMVSPDSILRKLRIPVRVLTAALPVLGAMLVSNLDEILEWCGFLGVMICFIFPGFLNLYSWKACHAIEKAQGSVDDAAGSVERNNIAPGNENSGLLKKSMEVSPPSENPYSNIFTSHSLVYSFLAVSGGLIVLILLLTGFPEWFA
eukprot:TRINITY_DN4554_c0_g1_i1.p1 TRINITY_DN4554_c0_g1~~TRINITY_DN4554_c0_g1_i1.p1  ORF type:complete len:531 (-),score=127.29 TRINITY_DN4554_c0_g1_i1:35-1627(-)